MPEAPRRAKFAQVPATARRNPSWLPSAQRPHRKEPSIRPPRLPSEFVDAVRQELGEMPQQERRSIPPRPPTLPPPAQEVAAPSVAPPSPVAVPTVDPGMTAAFEEAVELLINERQRVFEQTASQLAELAAVIARRVIAREISLHPELVCDLVREGLDSLGKHDRVVVRLGQGFETQRASLEQRLLDRGSRAEVRVEPQLSAFACFVETDLGQVDESVEARLATLLHALRPDSQPAE